MGPGTENHILPRSLDKFGIGIGSRHPQQHGPLGCNKTHCVSMSAPKTHHDRLRLPPATPGLSGALGRVERLALARCHRGLDATGPARYCAPTGENIQVDTSPGLPCPFFPGILLETSRNSGKTDPAFGKNNVEKNGHGINP